MGDFAGDALKNLILQRLVAAGLKKLVAAVPILGIPFLQPIVVHFLTKYGLIFLEETGKFIRWEMIEFNTKQENDAFAQAKDKFESSLGGTDEELRKASDEFNRTFDDLINQSDFMSDNRA